MTKIYGCLLLENLVKKDEYFTLQMKLYERGLIQGIQLLVAHPCYTPDITSGDLLNVFSVLPKKLEIIVHCGAENCGVDFGENFDEKREFQKYYAGLSWATWNRETLGWALIVASGVDAYVVVHPGYGRNFNDENALQKILTMLRAFPDYSKILLENVPPFDFVGFEKWGFGGIPSDMGKLVAAAQKHCLIDFTHLWVAVNQARKLNRQVLEECVDLEKTITDFLALPHLNICHFSGLPDGLQDDHEHLHVKPPAAIREAIRQMDAVCLEISYHPNPHYPNDISKNDISKTQKGIETFRELYLE